jgi:DNA recombination protein RmuC
VNSSVVVFAVSLLLVAVVAAAVAWRLARGLAAPRGPDPSFQLLQQQLDGLRSLLSESLNGQVRLLNEQLGQVSGQFDRRLADVAVQIQNSQKSVGERLDNAARVVGEVQRSLGSLGQATERLFEVGKDIAGLQEILQAPKLRGGFGEFFLNDLLAQILPAKHFETQYGFKTGDKVDAVIRLGGRLVPVDSKFPLENFRRVVDAKTDEEARQLRKKFASDVKKHIDAIAHKYILPDEGTYDFALMYIPAENVYYEVIVKDEASDGEKSLTDYALAKKVVPVSPNSFYAYLQAIILGLRGFEIEENARVIMQNLSRLRGDFQRFQEDFDVLGKHLSSSRSKYEDAEKRLSRLQDKLTSVSRAEGADLPAPITPELLPGRADTPRPR